MSKGDEIVKLIAERLLTYLETPREERHQARVSHREQRETWQTRWFGQLPLAARMLLGQTRGKKGTPPNGG
ncbi:YqzE family protein [Paenibacillus athensensis]|uniref:YqzE family protein n=1 Tax=Paenibacillus athensensis TaxID=1967502 RepID=A0A4Y8PQU0_9BACL|nr:YqzE family protein [Paenibacillus athensensis]MCD1259285.1 YqzE family protein [Paenibacillus athensensis]